MIEIYVDADACPVKDEIYQVAARHGVWVLVVANSKLRIPEGGAEMIVVDQGMDAADDWIAEEVPVGDIVITADIPLAARCLDAGARVLGPSGRPFEHDSIGQALASREIGTHLRATGESTGGPPPLLQADRSRFLSRLDQIVQRGLRD